MKLETQLTRKDVTRYGAGGSRGPQVPGYRLEYKVELSDSERALLDRAEAWEQHVGHFTPYITVRDLVEGGREEKESLWRIQEAEGRVTKAAGLLRELVDETLKGFGQRKVREY